MDGSGDEAQQQGVLQNPASDVLSALQLVRFFVLDPTNQLQALVHGHPTMFRESSSSSPEAEEQKTDGQRYRFLCSCFYAYCCEPATRMLSMAHFK